MTREERMAFNEAIARDTNEMVERIAEAWTTEGTMVFRCECARGDCRDTMQLTREEYESVREEGVRFAVVADHVEPEVERVVGYIRAYAIVEKTDPEAREIAESTDPRGD